MLTRTIEERITFRNPFKVPGLSKLIPAGTYRINVMQDLLEGLSFLAYLKTNVILYIPTDDVNSSPCERSIIFEPKDFDALLLKDKTNKTGLFYRIKAKIDKNSLDKKKFDQGIRSQIERAENEGMYIPTT